MFTVQPARLSEEAQRLSNLGYRLDRITSLLSDMGRELMENLETESVAKTVVSIEKLNYKLSMELEDMKTLAETLEKVSTIYNQCEKRIVAEAQEVSLMHRNVSAQISDLSWYSEKLSDLKFR